MSVHLFGIRHHGPGCARGLLQALQRLRPDMLLVEGPPEGEAVLQLLNEAQMQPPVALLVYPNDHPQRAAFFPMAVFSPEYQALRYGLQNGIPTRFMDMPQGITFSLDAPDDEPEDEADEDCDHAPGWRSDPLAMLAEAAGYQEHELWWEQQIEQRRDATGLFDAIREAMVTLRADAPPAPERDQLREAYMRQAVRQAESEGHQHIAVVCGAWHVPALIDRDTAKSDTALLRGLKPVRVTATWTAWTHSRLAYSSGYGAGVTSPGWYHHLWTSPDQAHTRWLAQAARLLRENDLDASSASVIECVRLADALAAMRDLCRPGLTELNETVLSVLCHGDAAPMRLIRGKLEIGDALGQIPPATPQVPLSCDLEAQRKRLRLQMSAEIRDLELDLRQPLHLQRSQLLHRLNILGIAWGTPRHTSGTGTFKEGWRLQWQPEFAVAVIEANVWGNTIADAATHVLRHAAENAQDLAELTDCLDRAILAALPESADVLVRHMQVKSAVGADVCHLMDALPPLARIVRYGDVRQTRAEALMLVLHQMFERIIIGLPGACSALDNDAAARMIESLEKVQDTLKLLDWSEQRREWHERLRSLLDADIHRMIRGWCCRILLEDRQLESAELQRLARLALSPANPAAEAAAWLQGLLSGSATVLLYEDGLWMALDDWVVDLDADIFNELLPLLRRAFASFKPPERREMGIKIKYLRTQRASGVADAAAVSVPLAVNTDRANRVLPVLAHVLGVSHDD